MRLPNDIRFRHCAALASLVLPACSNVFQWENGLRRTKGPNESPWALVARSILARDACLEFTLPCYRLVGQFLEGVAKNYLRPVGNGVEFTSTDRLMKNFMLAGFIALTISATPLTTQAGGGHGYCGGGYHGGGCWGGGWHGGYGWCGSFWPAFGIGVGLGVGVGLAASAPTYAYYPAYPAYPYAYAPVTYTYARATYVSQPVQVYSPAATATVAATSVTKPAPATSAYSATPAVYATVPQQQTAATPATAVVASTSSPSATPTTVASSQGTWVQDPHPYRYVPAPASNDQNGGPAFASSR